MKKSVVILIGLIYAASIVLVSYLGLNAKSYNDIVYPESLVIENEYETVKGEKHIDVKANADGTGTLQLLCKILPEDAKNKTILYTVDDNLKDFVTISEDGLLIADKIIVDARYEFMVHIVSQEKPSIRDYVWVRFTK